MYFFLAAYQGKHKYIWKEKGESLKLADPTCHFTTVGLHLSELWIFSFYDEIKTRRIAPICTSHYNFMT